MRDAAVDITIVVPVFNERDSLQPLHASLTSILKGVGRTYEIIFVDDGSDDGTEGALEDLVRSDAATRALMLRRNFGKSAALAAGFDDAAGRVVITLDGDLQDDPDEIPGFLEMLDEGYDLVSGWKKQRRDPVTKRWPSRCFNFVTSKVTGIPLNDFNCGFKAYRRSVVESIELYGELHRFVPVLAARQGFKIGEKTVRHHPRRYGKTKFGAARFLNGFLDLLTVMFMSSNQRSPLHVFGRIGVLFLSGGILLNLYMVYIWILEHGLRVRPLLLFGVILVILGIQFMSIGLLAELVAGLRRDRPYAIKKSLPGEFPPGLKGGGG